MGTYVLYTESTLVARQPDIERTTSLLYSERRCLPLCCAEAGDEDTLCNISPVAVSHMHSNLSIHSPKRAIMTEDYHGCPESVLENAEAVP